MTDYFRSKAKNAQQHALVFCFVIALPLIASTGCGAGDRPLGVAVSGQVAFKGKPLQQGKIFFEPLQGDFGAAADIADGAFKLPASRKLQPGKYRVSISSMQPTGRMVVNPDVPDQQMEETREAIPMRYNVSSELTCTLAKDQTAPLEFALD